MEKSIFRRTFNRVLHLIAPADACSKSFCPFLHRLRGVTIKKGVFIGDDVYIDNEYPECVELHENVSVSMRALLVAHTRGPGRIILERNSFVGPNAIVCCYAGRVIRIGKGRLFPQARSSPGACLPGHSLTTAFPPGGAN